MQVKGGCTKSSSLFSESSHFISASFFPSYITLKVLWNFKSLDR